LTKLNKEIVMSTNETVEEVSTNEIIVEVEEVSVDYDDWVTCGSYNL